MLSWRKSHRKFPPARCCVWPKEEGRNAVHLAALGHRVTAVDQSEVGLAKARRLAGARGVEIEAVLYRSGKLFHRRRRVGGNHRDVCASAAGLAATGPPRTWWRGVQSGGVFILEAYTPAQLAFDTGGPKKPERLMTLAVLREELSGIEFLVARELERDVTEGCRPHRPCRRRANFGAAAGKRHQYFQRQGAKAQSRKDF